MNAALEALLARLSLGALQSCERLSGGASQESWRLVTSAGRFALRRSSTGAAEARLQRTALEGGVPVARIVHVLEPADGLGPGYLSDWLEGETLGARIARGANFAAVRPQLARQCGEILARIHALPVPATLAPSTPEQLVQQTWKTYQGFGTAQPMIDFSARWLLENLPPPVPPRLVHGDFRNGNLMVDPARGIVGVLDWELAHVGDPLRDLGWLCTPSWRFGGGGEVGGFGPIDELLDGYAAVSGTRPGPEALRFWIVFGAFWWSVGTLMMTQLHRRGADRSIERLAIGRRSSECQLDCAMLLIPGDVQPLTRAAVEVDMPGSDELLDGVAIFLREQAGAANGRPAFLSRVAANAVDIARRELALGPAARAREQAGLETLLGDPASRSELCRRLRGGLSLSDPGLAQHLRQSVADRVAIDQPRYPTYVRLFAEAGASGKQD